MASAEMYGEPIAPLPPSTYVAQPEDYLYRCPVCAQLIDDDKQLVVEVCVLPAGEYSDTWHAVRYHFDCFPDQEVRHHAHQQA